MDIGNNSLMSINGHIGHIGSWSLVIPMPASHKHANESALQYKIGGSTLGRDLVRIQPLKGKSGIIWWDKFPPLQIKLIFVSH